MDEISKKAKLSEIIVVLGSILVIGGLVVGLVLKKNQQIQHDNQRKAALNQIQDKLEKYFENEGVYPKDLQGLVPNYLNQLPKPVADRAWKYETANNDQTYVLKVEMEKAQLSDDNVVEDTGILYYQLQSKQ